MERRRGSLSRRNKVPRGHMHNRGRVAVSLVPSIAPARAPTTAQDCSEPFPAWSRPARPPAAPSSRPTPPNPASPSAPAPLNPAAPNAQPPAAHPHPSAPRPGPTRPRQHHPKPRHPHPAGHGPAGPRADARYGPPPYTHCPPTVPLHASNETTGDNRRTH